MIHDEAGARPRLWGPSREWSPSLRDDKEGSVSCRRDHLAFGTTTVARSGGLSARASLCGRKQLCFGRECCDLNRIAGVGSPAAASEQARVGAVQALRHRWVDHMEEHDLSVWGGDFGNGIDTRLPGAIGEPRDELHENSGDSQNRPECRYPDDEGGRNRQQPQASEVTDGGADVVGEEDPPPQERRERSDIRELRPDIL